MKTQSALNLVASVLLLPLIGCESASTPVATPPPVPHPQALGHPNSQLSLFEASMVRSTSRMLSGDLRPIWVVSGRIENHTQYFVEEVWVEVTLYNTQTGKQADSSVIKLEHLRLPPNDSVVAFSRSIQILPPSTGWGWRYEIISAMTEPESGDIQQ